MADFIWKWKCKNCLKEGEEELKNVTSEIVARKKLIEHKCCDCESGKADLVVEEIKEDMDLQQKVQLPKESNNKKVKRVYLQSHNKEDNRNKWELNGTNYWGRDVFVKENKMLYGLEEASKMALKHVKIEEIDNVWKIQRCAEDVWGTWVNGELLAVNETKDLENGDFIHMAQYEFIFSIEE